MAGSGSAARACSALGLKPVRVGSVLEIVSVSVSWKLGADYLGSVAMPWAVPAFPWNPWAVGAVAALGLKPRVFHSAGRGDPWLEAHYSSRVA